MIVQLSNEKRVALEDLSDYQKLLKYFVVSQFVKRYVLCGQLRHALEVRILSDSVCLTVIL
jgi:hypothetical protein